MKDPLNFLQKCAVRKKMFSHSLHVTASDLTRTLSGEGQRRLHECLVIFMGPRQLTEVAIATVP